MERERPTIYVRADNGSRAAAGNIYEAAEPCPSCEKRLLSPGRLICRRCQSKRDGESTLAIGIVVLFVWLALGAWIQSAAARWSWTWGEENSYALAFLSLALLLLGGHAAFARFKRAPADN
jgi:hypothetical protein